MKATLVIAATVVIILAFVNGKGVAEDFSLENTEVRRLYNALMKSVEEACSSLVGAEAAAQRVFEAQAQKDWKTVIEILEPFLTKAPDNLWCQGFYERVTEAYRKAGDPRQADAWARRATESIREYIRHSTKAESLLLIELQRRLQRHLAQTSEEDHRQEKAFFDEALALSQYVEWKDLVWYSLCDLQYETKDYMGMLETCDAMDAYYGTLPPAEEGRMLHGRWRARALQGLNRVDEAVTLLEALTEHPYAAIQKESLLREAEEMRLAARENGAARGEEDGNSSSETPPSEHPGSRASQTLDSASKLPAMRPSILNEAAGKGCGGQHSAGCATGTGGGCGAVKVTESQGAGCACGSTGCGGQAAGALARPSKPKPIVAQDRPKSGERDSPLVTSAGASCCSTTAAKPAAASKAAAGCGQGCGCGCGAAASPARRAPKQPEAPAPAAK